MRTLSIVVNPQPTQNLEESDSDAETKEKEKISWTEAAESLNKFISFDEASTSYSASEIIDFHIIRNKFYTIRQKSRKQKDIRDFFKVKYVLQYVYIHYMKCKIKFVVCICSLIINLIFGSPAPSRSRTCRIIRLLLYFTQ